MANSGGSWITYKGRRIYIGGKKGGSSTSKGKDVDKNKKSKSSNNEEAKTYMQDQFKAFDKGDISSVDLEKAKKDSGLSKEEIDNARKYVNDRAPENYAKATENKSGNTTSQAVPNKESSSKAYKAADLQEGQSYEIDMGNGEKRTAIYLGKDTDGFNAFYDGKGKMQGTFSVDDDSINGEVKVTDNKDHTTHLDLKSQLRHRDSNAEHKTKINNSLDVPARIQENADIAEKIIIDDEWNDISVSYNGGTGAEIINERTGNRVKIGVHDNKKTLSKKIEESYKEKDGNDWVKNAFNQYKKDHPGTKLTIQDFMKRNK